MLSKVFGRGRKPSKPKKQPQPSHSGDEEDEDDAKYPTEPVPLLSTIDSELDPMLEGKYQKAVEEFLKSEARKSKDMVTVLLIGPGESGKTTFMKQIARIHGGDVPMDELLFHRENVRHNVVEGMIVLCEFSKEVAGDCAVAADLEVHRDEVLALEQKIDGSNASELVDLPMQTKFDMLWEDRGIQKCFGQRHTFEIRQVPYHMEYLMSRRNYIWLDDYVPSYDDYLKVRVRTTGIREEVFWSGSAADSRKSASRKTRSSIERSVPFKFVDVGGQRSERRKWMRVFDATAALYVLGVGDYDLFCFEDGETKRMDEALLLFDKLCSTVVDREHGYRFFDQKSVIVFFNKWDVLISKLSDGAHPFSLAFDEDDSGVDEAREREPDYIFEFMCAKMNAIIDKHKPKILGEVVHFHRTRATSIKNVQMVIRTVQSDILNMALAETGFL